MGGAERAHFEVSPWQFLQLASDGTEPLHTHLYQVDEDTEVSNSHVPVEELLFMNLGAANIQASLNCSQILLTMFPLIYGS